MSERLALTDVELSDSDVDAYLDRLRSGWLTMGPSTQQFEEAFASHFDTSHAIAVSSGTAGLQLALLAAGVSEGDEVILPAFAFVAAANAIRHVRATPVLSDTSGPLAPVLDPEAVERSTTRRTTAVIVRHPFGHPAPVSQLKSYCDARGIRLIEDATDAVGARAEDGTRRVGTDGDLGVFSFRATSALPVGEGGMVVTPSEALAARVRLLRSHAMTSVTWDRHRGHAASYDVVDIGFNYRLDEPRAALGISRLGALDAHIVRRRARARAYCERLRHVSGVELPWSDDDLERSSHSQFAIVLANRSRRDRIYESLGRGGIRTSWHPALTELTGYAGHRDAGGFPHAEGFAGRHLLLPFSARLRERDIEAVTDAVGSALASG